MTKREFKHLLQADELSTGMATDAVRGSRLFFRVVLLLATANVSQICKIRILHGRPARLAIKQKIHPSVAVRVFGQNAVSMSLKS
jgi:hypothetical protein